MYAAAQVRTYDQSYDVKDNSFYIPSSERIVAVCVDDTTSANKVGCSTQ